MARGRGWSRNPSYGGYARDPYPGPREARGGIKAQTQRGSFGQSWWARRWIEVVEGFHVGGRLSRGRTYARQGQVLSVEVHRGAVRARVQGSRVRPYDVTIRVKTLTAAEWQRVLGSLAAEALHAARLLNGEMPREVEDVFARSGLSLFPQRLQDLETVCSCPDWSNPCKHVAAVFYLVAEELDRDPFLLFRLRGLDRDGLLSALAGPRADGAADEPECAEPLPVDPGAFWRGAAPASGGAGSEGARVEDGAGGGGEWMDVAAPPVAAALLRRLGRLSFWRGSVPFPDALEGVYAAASELALALLAGEGRDPAEGPESGTPAGGDLADHAMETPAASVPRRPGGAEAGAGKPDPGRSGRHRSRPKESAARKSRDRTALQADLEAGVPWEELCARYDGRILRPFALKGQRPAGRRVSPGDLGGMPGVQGQGRADRSAARRVKAGAREPRR